MQLPRSSLILQSLYCFKVSWDSWHISRKITNHSVSIRQLKAINRSLVLSPASGSFEVVKRFFFEYVSIRQNKNVSLAGQIHFTSTNPAPYYSKVLPSFPPTVKSTGIVSRHINALYLDQSLEPFFNKKNISVLSVAFKSFANYSNMILFKMRLLVFLTKLHKTFFFFLYFNIVQSLY